MIPKKEALDQLVHFMAALIILSLPVLLGWFGGALAGFAIGLVREATEEADTVTPRAIWNALRSVLDLTFWTLGGLAVSVILY
jgi:uncharacterized membrane protein YjfL (UPF0719 family)